MGIRQSKNQDGVPKGKLKFDFDIRYEGKRYRKTITCQKSSVNTFYRRWESEVIDNLLGKFMLFEKLDEYLKYSKDTKSDRSYKNDFRVINKLFKVFFKKDTLLKDVKRSIIDDYVRWRRTHILSLHDNTKSKGKVTNASINRDIAVLSYFFNWCITKEFYNMMNPCFRIKLKESNAREVRITNDQLKIILDTAFNQDMRLYNFVSVALLTGMRRGEILSLKWNEINFDTSRIMLSQFKTKSKKARVIPVTPSLQKLLLTLKNQNKNSEFVFENISETIIKKEWIKLRNKLSFTKFNDGSFLRIHDLRHIYAQTLLDQGIQMEDIQFLLGHQNITTTQKRYAMFARPDLHQKTGVLDNVIKIREIV